MNNPTTNDKKKLRIVYRSNSHSPLWIVAEKAGIWDKNGRKLPSYIHGVRKTRIHSQAAGGRALMGGVTGNKDPIVPITIGNQFPSLPWHN